MVLWPSRNFCHAPALKDVEEPPQPAPVPDKSPAELTWTHCVPPLVRLSRGTAPEANNVPFSLDAPTTPRVVEGEAVSIPTLPELITERIDVSVVVPTRKRFSRPPEALWT